MTRSLLVIDCSAYSLAATTLGWDSYKKILRADELVYNLLTDFNIYIYIYILYIIVV